MFTDEIELRQACKEILEEKGVRIKYLQLLLDISKEGVEYWDSEKIYDNFKRWTDLAIKNNLI